MNKIMLLGRLTKDPEIRYTQTNNTPVASFSLAVDRRFAKENETKVDFFNCVAWNKLAEIMQKYVIKGQQIVVVGRLQNRSYQDQQGIKHFITEIIVEEIYFCGSKQEKQEVQKQNQARMDESGDDLPF